MPSQWNQVQLRDYETDRLKNFYDDPVNVCLFREKIKTLFNLCAVPKHVRILEIGCGIGISAVILKEFGYFNVFGIDLSIHNIKAARNNTMKSVVAIAECLPFQDQSFDLVFGMDILHHIEDLDSCAREIRRVAKGYMFYEPNILNPFSFLWGIPKAERGRLRNYKKYLVRNGLPEPEIAYDLILPYNSLKKFFHIKPSFETLQKMKQWFSLFPSLVYPKIIYYSSAYKG